MNVAELPRGSVANIVHVGGSGSFRRRLMELGLLPGTRVELVGTAPLGDPLELLVRGSSLSIRRSEALTVEVTLVSETDLLHSRASQSVEPRSMASAGRAEGTP